MQEVTRTVMLEGGGEALHLRSFRLTVVGDPREQWQFGQRRITIGSREPADVCLDDARVSKLHAAIEADARGYCLIDEDSKNGTWLDGRLVQRVYLSDGDEFTVGQTRLRLELDAEEVELRISARERFGDLLGASVPMREVFGLLERVSPTDLTVLVEGRSGTGKELAAAAIHRHSPRHAGPFVVFDCSAVSHDLIESELFGHVKGAFTGAVAARAGAFEQASGGTLFIDELGELSPELQPKLLRALETRTVKRVGSNESVSVDVRIVAATNRSLQSEVARGNFREDLYYRFAVVRAYLPALAERSEDIPMLAEHFLQEIAARTGRQGLKIQYETMKRLKAHPWPGNVRELRNFMERAVALANEKGEVDEAFLQPVQRGEASAQGALNATLAGVNDWSSRPFKDVKGELVEAFERTYWQTLLEQTGGNISESARIAGVHRKSVEYILRKVGLARGDFS
jgi:DNA-binding NtrC family response regulator